MLDRTGSVIWGANKAALAGFLLACCGDFSAAAVRRRSCRTIRPDRPRRARFQL